ncbi:hypothetical protein ALP47_05114 [Pseudomonas savastanoi]|nr:hypothetical protein ALP47_05114 [Pseudomonas savastanoi]
MTIARPGVAFRAHGGSRAFACEAPTMTPEARDLEAASHLDLLEDFDLVTDLDVVVALDADTAFHACTYFGSVVLEAAQGFQLAFKDNDVFAQNTNRTVTVDSAFQNHTACDRAEFRRTEHIADFGDTQDILPNVAAKHTGEGFLDVFDDVVDHVVVTHIQTFLLDNLARASIGTHVEAKQYSVGGQCKVGVALGDTTDTATDYAHLHFVVTQAAQGALQCFQRTADVGFEDDVKRLLLFLTHVLEDVLQLAGMSASQFDLAELALAEQSDFAGFLLVSQHRHLVASIRSTVKTQDFDRDRRTCFFDRLAVLVKHGTDAAEVRTDQNHVALTQRTVLNQNSSDRTTALVQTGLDNNATTRGRRSCLEFQNFGLQQNSFQQLVDASTHFRGYRNERRITAPLFGRHAMDRQLAADTIEVSTRLVDLVHRNNQRNASRNSMLNSFDGLRHNAVVSCNHQNHDIRCLGTTGTHGGKRGVTRGVEERDHAAFGFNVVGTDVLGDAASFASCNLGTTDVVEQRGLTVVDVAHYGHDRCTGERLTFELQRFGQGIFQGVVADQRDLVAQLFGDQLGSFLIQYLVDGHRSAHLEHELDDFSSLDRHLCRQFADSDGLADGNVTDHRAGRALETMCIALLQLGLAATTTTEAVAFFVGSTRSNARGRSLLLDRSAMRSVFTLPVAAAGIAVVSTRLVRATLFVTLASVSRRRCAGRCRSSRCWCWRFTHRLSCSNRLRGCRSRLAGGRLIARIFFSATLGFFFSLLTSGIFYRTAFVHLALALGFDLFRATLHKDFLLAHFNADALAASNAQGAGGLALQGNLARLFHLGLVTAFQVRQQGLFFVIGHNLLGGGVRQTCLTHLL